MKILNKRKAKTASLPKLNKIKGFIEKLIRKKDLLKEPNICGRLLQLKEDDLSYPNYCIMQKDHGGDHTDYRGRVGQPLNFSFRSQGNVFFDQKSNCNKVVAEGLKTTLENALANNTDSPIQYFKKINTEDALARGYTASTITRDNDLINGVFTPSNDDHLIDGKEEITETKQDYFIIEKRKIAILGSDRCPYLLVLGNHDNSLPVNPTKYYCVCDKDHEGQHQTYRNNISIQWDDPEIENKDSLCTEYCYPATDFHGALNKVQCILPEFHPGKHKGKRPKTNEYFLWSIDSNTMEYIGNEHSANSFPTSENNPSFSRNSENSESSDKRKLELIRELFCLKTINDYYKWGSPKSFCLASKGHKENCEDITIDDFGCEIVELLDKEKELSSINDRIYPSITEQQAKDCIEAIKSNGLILSLPVGEETIPIVALAVCNKQFNDFDGNIFYCLDEIGHERECGYYSAATLLDKLQKRLEGLNKQMEDKTI